MTSGFHFWSSTESSTAQEGGQNRELINVSNSVSPIRNIAVVGSRSLPAKYSVQIGDIVNDLIARDFHIATGGALGADDYVLTHLLKEDRCDRGVVFSAWNTFKGFPVKVRKNARLFQEQGGSIMWGSSSGTQHPATVKAALLERNCRLIQASHGVVAFVVDQSRGTMFTVLRSIQNKLRLVGFAKIPCGPITPKRKTGPCFGITVAFRPLTRQWPLSDVPVNISPSTRPMFGSLIQ